MGEVPLVHIFLTDLCLIRIKQCGSHNTFENDPGMAPPLSAYAGGITKDQIPAHLGWIPDKIVESLSGHRLLVPCYVACVGSLAEMQSHMREQFGKPDYDAEQQRIHIAGLMEGWYSVPGFQVMRQDEAELGLRELVGHIGVIFPHLRPHVPGLGLFRDQKIAHFAHHGLERDIFKIPFVRYLFRIFCIF